ncbi:hypothetical protein LU699_13620 [Luteimonas fraxinea]|uniref:Uncharacterized protein n=1 Tax=Luteimonas fraxinea TaxID=2901869 RepID=A0ABS8UHH6_9GAMM|nr:hypothetical protein [Luteimonas fraxinea]MCD9097945.1 hypothetical protein [Luteimonas fraxinea]UHH09322.1 hypothetical protein LU699_13620 [Luteimonas fraxinea]
MATGDDIDAVPADAPGITAYGDAAIAELAAIDVADTLDAAPAAALVARLRDLHIAMRAALPSRGRPRAGLFACLTGRDVIEQHDAEALGARMGVLLIDADRAAAALRADIAAHRARLAASAPALDRLDRAAAALRAGSAEDEVHQDLRLRRAQHLDTVRATHALSAQQLQLIAEQHEAVLAHYRNVRDVLLPLWRQRAVGERTAQGAAHAVTAADIEADVAHELDAMTATLARRAPDRADRPKETDA